jgi:L-fuculose-phosphate aldolase
LSKPSSRTTIAALHGPATSGSFTGAIYEKTSALVVIHADARAAIKLSLSQDKIIPIDNQGSYLLRKIPVITVELASGSKEMAEKVSEALRGYKIIMQRDQGCFAIGQTLEEAYHWVSALEEVSKIILEPKRLGEEMIE